MLGARVKRMPSSTVRIYEVAPRDGLQNEATVVPTAAKAELIARLAATGLRDIEATSFVRPRWIPQLADAAELVPMLPRVEGVDYWGLIPNPVGLERAIACGIRCAATFLSASETHNKKNVNRTVRESLAGVIEVLQVAKDEGMKVRSYISTVFGCPYEGHVAPEASIHLAEQLFASGADTVVLGDTVGMGNPAQVVDIVDRCVKAGFPLDRIAMHFHDTRGTALANTLAAWQCGITAFDASVGGLGGCPYAPGASGNLSTEDVVHMFEAMGVSTGVDLDALSDVGLYAEELLGRPLPGRYHQFHQGAIQRSASRTA